MLAWHHCSSIYKKNTEANSYLVGTLKLNSHSHHSSPMMSHLLHLSPDANGSSYSNSANTISLLQPPPATKLNFTPLIIFIMSWLIIFAPVASQHCKLMRWWLLVLKAAKCKIVEHHSQVVKYWRHGLRGQAPTKSKHQYFLAWEWGSTIN